MRTLSFELPGPDALPVTDGVAAPEATPLRTIQGHFFTTMRGGFAFASFYIYEWGPR
jgi:hypothetical protein